MAVALGLQQATDLLNSCKEGPMKSLLVPSAQERERRDSRISDSSDLKR
jgi:hypothetical protein